MEINDLRGKIDEIDGQLVELLKERLCVAGDIARYKADNHLPITDTERERKLLNRVSGLAGDEFDIYTRVLFSSVMDISRSYQNEINRNTSRLYEKIEGAVKNTSPSFPEKALVACQGVEGAYSQAACEKIFTLPDIMYVKSFEAVFKAVDSGLCRYGVVPIENSTAGSVNSIYDLISRYNFSVIRSVRLHVGHSLLAKPGTAIGDIKEVFSHEQAITQCSEYLKALGVKITVCENTAMAAEMVAGSDRHDIAAICSGHCASLYNLVSLCDSVQNTENNFTRFICISKELEIYPGAERTSIMLTIPHRPGSLSRTISLFSSLGINLIKLESRPIPGQNFEFMFYFDVDADIYSDTFRKLICALESSLEFFRYMGSYSEIV